VSERKTDGKKITNWQRSHLGCRGARAAGWCVYDDYSALYCSVALWTAAVANRPTNGQTERPRAHDGSGGTSFSSFVRDSGSGAPGSFRSPRRLWADRTFCMCVYVCLSVRLSNWLSSSKVVFVRLLQPKQYSLSAKAATSLSPVIGCVMFAQR